MHMRLTNFQSRIKSLQEKQRDPRSGHGGPGPAKYNTSIPTGRDGQLFFPLEMARLKINGVPPPT